MAELSIMGRPRYVEFFTDFGFKRLFGSEPNKECVIDFLNELLGRARESKIKNITYLKNEQTGVIASDRRAVYDVLCEDDKGDKFIVEMQNEIQHYYKERTIYYSTFLISSQAIKGPWDYKLAPVYVVSLLNFDIDKESAEYRHDVELVERQSGKVFYDKLLFIYLELKKFKKKESELVTRFEKWMYVLSNLSRFDNIPNTVREKVFERFFEVAEISRLSKEELAVYEENLKNVRDEYSIMETKYNDGLQKGKEEGHKEGKEEGHKEGKEEGKEEGIRDVAKNLLSGNVPISLIIKSTGLSEEELRRLSAE